ncbi:uncharacterized protein [Procambarus clarkii]|uniref:uncharacterized protein n=1 Tax=Procambarus clarkii TaxID=6728 RepID=UPI003743B4F0
MASGSDLAYALWDFSSVEPILCQKSAQHLKCLKSPKEFVDLLQGAQATGTRASLDRESLFTNVPMDETIKMMMDRVYRDAACTPLDIPESILRKLLQACTKEAPFLSPDEHMYKQVDGVAMGSSLGVLFANFYLGSIEQRVLVDMDLKPAIYCRFVDDILMQGPDVRRLQQLKEAFEQNPVLNFTYEMKNDGKLHFLDTNGDTNIGDDFRSRISPCTIFHV